MGHQQVDADFLNEIIVSDKAHFIWMVLSIDKIVAFWISENRREIFEKQMLVQRITFWRAFGVGGIIGPFFF